MPKRFSKPEETPTPTPEPEDTQTKTSLFSPFGNVDADRKKVLGEKLFSYSQNESAVSHLTDEEVEASYQEVEELLSKSKIGNTKMMSLVKAYRATSATDPRKQKRVLVDLKTRLEDVIKDVDGTAVLLAAVANLSFLMSKLGK